VNTALETNGLGKRYRRLWALRDCSLHLPAGRVAALVGPNGAGKTTLLHLAIGLLRPDAGAVRVLGETPTDGGAMRSRVGFVAQDVPLYRDFTAAELITMGGKLNRSRWDSALAYARLSNLGIPLNRRVPSCPAGSARRWRSRWPWPSGPTCCCSTSRWPASTRWPGASFCRR